VAPSASGGGALAAAGVFAVLISAAALILLFLRPDLYPAAAKAALFAGAIIGVVLGTLTLAWYQGVPRFTGVGVLLCGVSLLVAGLVLDLNPAEGDIAPLVSDDLTDPDATDLLRPEDDERRGLLDPDRVDPSPVDDFDEDDFAQNDFDEDDAD
jgi:hypothetical protein